MRKMMYGPEGSELPHRSSPRYIIVTSEEEEKQKKSEGYFNSVEDFLDSHGIVMKKKGRPKKK